MRIIGGIHKGKRIDVVKGLPVRPTTDFAKEALFNILFNKIDFEGAEILDLFCGTGNIALECASRGAHVTAIDMHFGCTKFVSDT
ncbi:MAG TPA: RsmD family RNA methyltransferase, partial [Bacteroidia bacterium]|nr:RsmD family RNA methyltransferase [Bacteroidia bacterium]